MKSVLSLSILAVLIIVSGCDSKKSVAKKPKLNTKAASITELFEMVEQNVTDQKLIDAILQNNGNIELDSDLLKLSESEFTKLSREKQNSIQAEAIEFVKSWKALGRKVIELAKSESNDGRVENAAKLKEAMTALGESFDNEASLAVFQQMKGLMQSMLDSSD